MHARELSVAAERVREGPTDKTGGMERISNFSKRLERTLMDSEQARHSTTVTLQGRRTLKQPTHGAVEDDDTDGENQGLSGEPLTTKAGSRARHRKEWL